MSLFVILVEKMLSCPRGEIALRSTLFAHMYTGTDVLIFYCYDFTEMMHKILSCFFENPTYLYDFQHGKLQYPFLTVMKV